MSDHKYLTLLRHAKSSWKDETLSDFDRPLNKRGQRDVITMSQRMVNRQDSVDVIITSPAVRALTTAKAFATALDLAADRLIAQPAIYEATVANLLTVIQGFKPSWQRVMLVGHNPGLTQLANRWAASPIDNLPTCGLVSFRFEMTDWTNIYTAIAQMICFDYPKRLD